MTFEVFITALFGSLTGAIGMSIVVFLCRTWITERLKQSISHEYALKLEEWKQAEQIRIKSEAVASLLAEWMSFPDEQKTLNKLTFEAYLWLPTEILQLLTKTLAHDPTAPNAREILSKVRQHLLKDGSLKASDIIIFKQESERRAFSARLSAATGFEAFRAASAMGMKGVRGRVGSKPANPKDPG
ncbi:hypothetical protein [Pseudomonas lundensis]|jgi:hypothetical protein|uniref:hypothetical protein n=1 Tax=Pseudomonas lundensis TaxID=86185 RepID=UPI00193C24A5|nr:hypothetical protein [Pseudomonas lundensis]MBM1182411.1 hypothetical protein [Pseudomonas lundensis]